MMKKQLYVAALCVLSTSFFCVANNPATKCVIRNNQQTRKLFSANVASLLVSGGVGALTGGLTAYGENALIRYMENDLHWESTLLILLMRFFSWTLESEVRNNIIAAFQDDFDAHDIQYKKDLMINGARLASWIAYLKNADGLILTQR